MKKRKIIAPLIVLAALAFGVAMVIQGWSEISGALHRARWGFAVIVLLIAPFNGLLSSYLWMWQFRLLGEKVSLFPVFKENMYAAVTRFVPVLGRALNIGGHVYYFAQMGVGARSVYIASVMDLMCTGAASGIIGCWLLMDYLPIWAILLLVCVGVALLNPKVLTPIVGWLLRKRTTAGDINISHRNILLLVLGYMGVWLSSGVLFYLLALVFFPVGPEHILRIAAANSAGWIMGYITFIFPMGIGVWDGIFLLSLKSIMPVGVATIVTIACRLLMVLGEFLVVGEIYLYDKLIYRK